MFLIFLCKVQIILKRKAEFWYCYEKNQGKAINRMCTISQVDNINNLLWEWFKTARSLGNHSLVPCFKTKTFYTSEVGLTNFKASNLWLGRFHQRNNIKFTSVCGECRWLWTTRRNNFQPYLRVMIFVLWSKRNRFVLKSPPRQISIKGKDCRGGNCSKNRITYTVVQSCNAIMK